MKTSSITPLLTLALVAIVFSGCEKQSQSATSARATAAAPDASVAASATTANAPATEKQTAAALPRLVDVGSKGCVPCRLMEPILQDLKTTRAHQFATVFHDIRTERQKIEEYQISIIPTQIFLDKDGKELFRHEGFFSKDEIMKKWSELGYAFDAKS